MPWSSVVSLPKIVPRPSYPKPGPCTAPDHPAPSRPTHPLHTLVIMQAVAAAPQATFARATRARQSVKVMASARPQVRGVGKHCGSAARSTRRRRQALSMAPQAWWSPCSGSAAVR
jgi:hypothetical protein